MNTKTCRTCKEEKNLDENTFRVSYVKNGKKVYRSDCRVCEAKSSAKYKKENPKKIKESGIIYRNKTRDSKIHIAARLIDHSKKRAKEKGITHSLTKEYISDIFPEHCPVLGYKLKCNIGGSPGPDSPSIDRMDNLKGYEPGNVRIISFEANAIKGAATSDKLYKVAQYTEHCEGRGNPLTRWLKKVLLKLF